MLDSQKLGLLALVRAALSGEKQQLPEDFSLGAAYDAIIKHNIVVMALEGALKCGIPKSDPMAAKLFRLAFQAIGACEAQEKASSALFAAFDAAGIDYMPVKGAILRGMYPKKEYRSMCDMDVLIRLEQYERIREIMRQQGYEEKQENDHELPWRGNGLYLELHKHLIPSDDSDFHSYYADSWSLAAPGGPGRREMRPEDHFIFVFVHFAKHYRGGGIGIRQMCDLYLLRRKQPDMDERYIRAELEKLNLLAFYENILQTLSAWFDGIAFTDKNWFITEVIYESGVYGRAKEYTLSQGAKLAKGESASRLVRYQRIWQRMFLPRKEMEYRYPALKKHPLLLLALWIHRGWHILVKEPGKIRREQARFHQLDHGEIDAYRQSLHYVGLKYD